MTKPHKLVLSTKKSIHPPLEIEVDGTLYPNNPLSRALFEELAKHEEKALAGDIHALYAQVTLLYNIPAEKLHLLDVRDIKTLLEFTMAKTFGAVPEKETEPEKTEKKE